MKSPLNYAFLVWSVRDVLRCPWDALLTGTALALVVGMMATAVMLTQSMANTAARLMAEGPSLVVRRLNAGGWAPIPAAESVAAALSVPGVIGAETRTWGVVRGPETLLTVVTASPSVSGGIALPQTPLPGPGQAVIGEGVLPKTGKLLLSGLSGHEFTVVVVDTFASGSSLFTHDIVLLHPEDARALLDIPNRHASDLIIEVFHAEEQEVFHAEEQDAILPDLIQALPWPVQITSRRDAVKAVHGGMFRRSSIVSVAMLPALLALALLVMATVRDRHARRYETGLLKALGWSTGDVVRMSLYRALFVGVPAAVLGGTAAYGLVFWTGAGWARQWILGWRQALVHLMLDPAGAVITLLAVAALALFPFIAAVLFPALSGASADVQEFMEKGVR